MTPLLSVNGLTKIFGTNGASRPVLDPVSFDVAAGEVVSIVGPSGCGKTTLLRCLAGLERPNAGSVQAPQRIAVISQSYANFPWMRARDNIAIAFHDQRHTAPDIARRVDALLNRFHLSAVADDYPRALSGGMQQRVAIARAIAQNAELILLDEPFGALDAHTRTQAQEFFMQLIEQENKTILLVTHDIDEALYLSDRVLVMGTHPGALREMIMIPFQRPRTAEVRFTEEFTRLKKSIHYLIRSELIRSSIARSVTGKASGSPIVLGLYIWSGNIPFYIAKESGLFTKHRLNPTIISSEQNNHRVQQWRRDEIDVLNVTLDTAIALQVQSPDTVILMALNQSVGSDALIARHTISSVVNLRGKRIGLEQGAVSQFFLHCILNTAGMQLSDIEIVNLRSSNAGAALIAGTIDAAVLWEPWLSKAKEFSQTRVLSSSADIPLLYDVLIVKQSTLKRKKAEIHALQAVWGEALTLLEQEPERSIAQASALIGTPDRELSSTLETIRFFRSTPPEFDRTKDQIAEILQQPKR